MARNSGARYGGSSTRRRVAAPIADAVGGQAGRAVSTFNVFDWLGLGIAMLVVFLLWSSFSGIIHLASLLKFILGVLGGVGMFVAANWIAAASPKNWVRLVRIPLLVLSAMIFWFSLPRGLVLAIGSWLFFAFWGGVAIAVIWGLVRVWTNPIIYLAAVWATFGYIGLLLGIILSSYSVSEPNLPQTQTNSATPQAQTPQWNLLSSGGYVYINTQAQMDGEVSAEEFKKYGSLHYVDGKWYKVLSGTATLKNGTQEENMFHDFEQIREGKTVTMPDGLEVKLENRQIYIKGGNMTAMPVDHIAPNDVKPYAEKTPAEFKALQDWGWIVVH